MKKRWQDDISLEANLQADLPRAARKYIKAGHKALSKERTWEEIHDFRLESKRFRYTIELFAPFYGEAATKRVEELKHVQKLLGDANDAVVTSGILEGIAGTEQVRQTLAAKADSKVRKLRAWWSEAFQTPLAETEWADTFAQLPIAPAEAIEPQVEEPPRFERSTLRDKSTRIPKKALR